MSVQSLFDVRPETLPPPDAPPADTRDPGMGQQAGAAARVSLDEAPGVQAYRYDEAYRPVVEALSERTGLPTSHWRKPWYERVALPYVDTSILDRDAIWRDIERQRAVDPKAFAELGKRDDFEQNVLRRQGGRSADEQILALGHGPADTAAQFAGGLVGSFARPENLATLPIGGAARTVAGRIVSEGLLNAGVTAASIPETKVARERMGEEYTPGQMAGDVALAGAFGVVTRGAIEAGKPALAPLRERFSQFFEERAAAKAFAEQVPPELRTPEQEAALHILTRESEIDDGSPFERTLGGDAAHRARLAETMDRMDNPGGRRGLGELEPRIVGFFRSRGYTEAQARGIAAGIHAESGSDPNARNRDSGAIGIGQWLGARQAELVRRYGPHPTLEQQLEFLDHELKGGDAGGKAVLAQNDEASVLRAYVERFMRPAAGAETTGDLARGMTALGRDGELPPVDAGTGAGLAEDVPIVRPAALDAERPAVTSAGSEVPLERMPVDAIGVNAELMQFKSGGDQFGVTDRLKGVEQWDPIAAGTLTVWQPLEGEPIVADGHQRLGLAKRIQQQTGEPLNVNAFVLREADGYSAKDARVITALKNIGEGTGSATDAAKVLRDVGLDSEAVLQRLPPRSALVRDGKALARLHPDAFGAVVNEVIPEGHAAAIGHLAPDPATHLGLVELLQRTDPPNRRQAEAIVRQAIDAGFTAEKQEELFGTRDLVNSLFAQRARVLDKGLAELKRLKGAFQVAARNAEALDSAGNRIDVAGSEAAAQGNARALALVERLALRKGNAVNELIDQATQRLAGGEPLTRVVRDFVGGVRQLDLAHLEREGGPAGGPGEPAGAGGRDGELASEADREPSPQELDALAANGQAGFVPAEDPALETFSDPDGEGAKAAAESDWHDIRAMHAEALAMINGPSVAGAALEAKIGADFAAARAEYEALPDSDGGRIINTDLARELSPEYRADRSRSAEVHEPASAFVKQLYKDKLAEPTPAGRDREVLFTAGGTGAGKSTGIAAIGGENAGIIYDTNMNTLASATAKIDQALAAGWQVKVVYTYRDPIEALVNGALPRAERMGRTVPLEAHVDTHVGARQVIAALAERYRDNPEVVLQVVDNSHGKGRARLTTLENVPPVHQEGLHDRAETEIRAAYERGAIGRQTLRGSLGERAGNLSPAARDGGPASGATDRGQPEQAGSRGPLDRGAQANPDIADRQRQEAALGAGSPLRARVEQSDTGGLGLFDQANEPTFDLEDGKGPRTAGEIDAEIRADRAGLEEIRKCLQ